jgi:chorismate mutase
MRPIHDRRRKIDGIDEKLVELLNRRARLAIEIGAFKRRIA